MQPYAMYWNPPPAGAPVSRPPSSRDLPGRVSPWWIVGGTIVGASLVFGGLVAYSTYAAAAEPGAGGPGGAGAPGGVPSLPPGEGPDIPGETPSGGGRDPDRGGMPGTGEIKPGPNNIGPKPTVDGWGGGQYGPGPIPLDFDWAGNLVYVSPDCRTIAEPMRFLPIPGSQNLLSWWMPANGGPSAQAPLAIALGWLVPDEMGRPVTGTAWGYIARLVARTKRDGRSLDAAQIERIAAQVLEEMLEFQSEPSACPNPLGPAAMASASPAFKKWWASFVERVDYGIKRFKSAWFLWNNAWDVE